MRRIGQVCYMSVVCKISCCQAADQDVGSPETKDSAGLLLCYAQELDIQAGMLQVARCLCSHNFLEGLLLCFGLRERSTSSSSRLILGEALKGIASSCRPFVRPHIAVATEAGTPCSSSECPTSHSMHTGDRRVCHTFARMSSKSPLWLPT